MRQLPRRFGPVVSLAMTLFVTGADAQWQSVPELEPAPELVDAWRDPPDLVSDGSESIAGERLSASLGPKSLIVDTGNRTAVAGLFHTVYTPALAVPIGWTGSLAGCVAGSTSQAYLDATIDMINYFRAMAGLPSIANDAGHNDEAQAAALMMDAANALDHSPDPTWPCYSTAGASGASSSNLALWTSGPSAIVTYVRDSGFSNAAVGHRRWILYPPRLEMAPGSTPGANALWVFSATGPRPASPTVVGWPPPGHVPYQVVYARWSMSLNSVPWADYSAAQVAMSEDGSPVPVTIVSTFSGYGDNTVVWQPSGLFFGPGQGDRRIRVTVTNIGGGPSSVSYDVVVIDPATVPTEIFDDGFEGGSSSAWSSVSP